VRNAIDSRRLYRKIRRARRVRRALTPEANLQIAYQVDKRVNVTLSMLSLIDQCYQRGYVWDNAMNCQYGQLPSNHLAPVGNFVPLATAPVQLRYPYGVYGNPTNNGFVATRMPFSHSST